MVFGCVFFPFRRCGRRKPRVSIQAPPRCPACLDYCVPPSPSPPVLESAGTKTNSDQPTPPAPKAGPPITIPCSQTYHSECLRELFTGALASKPYHPPRCCGSFIPLSTLYDLYPDQPEEMNEKEGAAAAGETSTPTPVPATRNRELAEKLAAFRGVTANAVDCAHCKKWLLPEDIDEELEIGYCKEMRGGCGRRTCIVCGETAHLLTTTPAIKEKGGKHEAVRPGCTKVSEKERSEVRFRRLVGREGWRQCGKCGWMLSRDTGCCEVICRCGNYETLAF